MSYEDQLKDSRWILLRQRIIERDFRVCQHCLSGKNLNVHHKEYIEGRLAWEYADWYLITLCMKCHKEWHEFNEVKVTKFGDPIVEATERIVGMIKALDGLSRG